MMTVNELARMELDNKVAVAVTIIENKIAANLKSSKPEDIFVTRDVLHVYNSKMFSEIVRRVSDECPGGITVTEEVNDIGNHYMKVNVNYGDLF